MIFGTRKRFMTTPKVNGVMVVPYTIVEGESYLDQVIADPERQGLRHETPGLETLENVHHTLEMTKLFRDHTEFGSIPEEVIMAW